VVPKLPRVELVFKDQSGSTSAVGMWLKPGSTYADADAAATALASVLLPLTDCVLIKQKIIYQSVEFGPMPAQSGSAIVRQGAFFFDCDDMASQCIITIPSIVDTVLVTTGFGAGIDIEVTNVDVIAFVNALLSGGVTNPFAVPIIDLVEAYLQSRT